MMFNDLRDYIATLEKLGELKHLSGASGDLEIGAVTELASFRETCPAVLFDTIQGFPKGYRILTNFLSNRTRERLVFGIPNDLTDPEAVLLWKKRLKQFAPIEPIEVAGGAVKENVLLGSDVDVTRFPWPKWHL